MSVMLKKILGIILLLSTVGLASCQAMWSEALLVPFPFSPWN